MFVRLSISFLLWLGMLCPLLGQTNYELPTWKKGSLNFNVLPSTEIHFDDFANNDLNNAEVLQSIIDDFTHQDSLLLIHFSDKEYFFDQTIELKSNIHLKGYSSSFSFDLQGSIKDCISITGNYAEDSLSISGPLFKGDNIITSDLADQFSQGDMIYLREKDNSLISSDWALGSSGQLLEVSSMSTGHIHLQNPLRRNYENDFGQKLILIHPIENVRISGIRVERLDSTTQQCSNILFRFARNCQIDCIESYSCNFAHVSIEYSNNIQVQNSFFKDGHTYVSGGRAYGIALHFASGECLVENNIFEHLRHSVLLQAGANGNIIAYNYSLDPYWEQFPFPENSAGEFVLHGNYPYANLFEGNVMSNLVADESHGLNGPDNTFFRNRIENGFVLILPSISQLHLIHNIAQNILYSNGSTTGLIESNLFNETIIGTQANNAYSNSLYQDTEPVFFSNFNYPPVFPDVSAFDNTLPAQHRYPEGYKTECQVPINTQAIEKAKKTNALIIQPNPCTDFFMLNSQEDITRLDLVSMEGRIKTLSPVKHQSTAGLNAGLYFIRIQYSSGKREVQKLVIQ